MSFLSHQEIYPSDGNAGIGAEVPAHRLDEFPVWLFLGELHSCMARFRFAYRFRLCGNAVLLVDWLSSDRRTVS